MFGAPLRLPRAAGHRMAGAFLLWAAFGLLAWGLHALVVAPPADAQAEQRGAARNDPLQRGAELWRRDCASCHGMQGDGTDWGPDLHDGGPAAVHLMVSTGRMPLEALSGLRDTAPDPQDEQVPRSHPAESDYLPGQVAALVAYARETVDGPDVPTVDIATADAANGAKLFQLNCASCHGWGGRGGVLANGHIATPLHESTPVQVVEAMRFGIGTMPEFAPALLDDQEAADIAAYVDYLQHARDPGGRSLAHLGPVAEGLAAGVFGIFGLLLVARWIGQRS